MDHALRLFDWLIDGAPGATTSPDVVERIGTELSAAGIPIARMAVSVTTLHPAILGRAFWWSPNTPVLTRELTHAVQSSAVFQRSPIAYVASRGVAYRKRVGEGTSTFDFEFVQDLQKEGFTDYLALPMKFLNGESHVVTFSTREPGGFTDLHVATFEHILRPLSRLAEIFALRRTAVNLLNTYVGRNTGEKILAGRIFKGDIESLRAVIWFSDLRGFTELSSRSTPKQVIDTLNELFECQVPAIEAHRGEVLKFIGDGLLAIFPVGEADVEQRAQDAIAAAHAAQEALAKRNADAKEPIAFGVALHVGDVAYGNVGSTSRLDFTVIGAAVNLSARLEGLTGKLNRPIVISEELARSVKAPLDDLGRFDLKGVGELVRAFAPKA
jgi:adenylate cyclase